MALRHLRYFVVLAEEENFHRAAERLHVSQSPLSRQMQDLQAELTVPLLEPSGRGVRLTSAGRLFAQRAAAILSSVEAAVAEAKLTAQGRIGTIPIGFETGAALFGKFATIVATSRRREPRITLELIPMSSAEQWEALRTGEIAFGYGNYFPGDTSLAKIEISRDSLGVVAAADHRFAARPEVTVADLHGEPVLMQPRRLYPRLHDDLIAAMRGHGVVLDVIAEVADLEALLTLVSSGDAITFLPSKQKRIPELTSAVWRPLADLDVQISDVVMWRAEDTGSPLLRPLIDVVQGVKADLEYEEFPLEPGTRPTTQDE
ncbi:LysR family transcriptional regulator [Amycolatopsis sp. cmx-4-68]|uniref:LysR family transcriptional regulator n=1 Tax=Amycolatopsis sp. cmx-4-68 TaxID=2790938 RepID=UPI00397AFB04